MMTPVSVSLEVWVIQIDRGDQRGVLDMLLLQEPQCIL